MNTKNLSSRRATMQFVVHVTDATTSEDIDTYLSQAWAYEKPIHLLVNISQCNNISLQKFKSSKKIWDKHILDARKYLKNSTIYVKESWQKVVMRMGIQFMQPEIPVNIVIMK